MKTTLLTLAVIATTSICFLFFGYYGGKSHPINGLPHTLNRGIAVSDADAELLKLGLQTGDRYFRSVLGVELEQVRVRLREWPGCEPFSQSTAGATAETLCIWTGKRTWKRLTAGKRTAALALVVHEHVHNLQGQLGCLPRAREDRVYQWFTEGMATHLSWEILFQANLATREDLDSWRDTWVDPDELLEPLASYETSISSDAQYDLARSAIAELHRSSGGVAELAAFCRRAASGSWRTAFADSFGETVENFYERFDKPTRFAE